MRGPCGLCSPPLVIAELKQTVAALEKGRTNEALGHLLTAWRAKRAPEIADAIDALAHAFPSPKLEGDAQSEWMTLARKGEAGDVYGLLATLLEAGPIGMLLGRVEQLVERPDDPRIALAFASFALDPPTTSSSNFSVWTKMFAYIEATGDARVVPILKKRAGMKPGASKFWPKLASWIERALKKIPDAPKLTKEEASAVTAIVRAAKKATPVKAAPAKAKKAATASGDPLARAIAAALADDLPACVEALLEGWRERRFAAYAEAIDRVTALHDEGIACPGGSDGEIQKAWLALAAKKRPIDVGRLADSVGDGKIGDVDKRLEEMLTWPADPRIGRSMFVHCESRTFSDRARTWGLVADLLVKNADVRLAPELAEFIETGGDNKARRSAMRRAGPAALKALEAVPKEPSPAELAAFDKLRAALDAWDAKRPITERRLLEAILAAPNDHGPALVYADWLTERGHPRGELIVMQCADEPDEDAMSDLIGKNARALLGPAACLPYSNLGYATEVDWFRRGLLSKIELRYTMPRWFFEGHPLLWFLEEIEDADDDDTTAALIASSRSLRTIEAQPQLAARMAASPAPLTVETVRFSYAREPETPMATLLDGIEGRGLSRVKHLELFWSNGDVHQDGIPDALAASPLFENLETLTVATANLASVLAALKKHRRTVTTLSLLRRHYLRFRLDVRLDAKLTPLAVSLHPESEDHKMVAGKDSEALVTALRSLELPRTTKLTVANGITFDASVKSAVSGLVTL